jgi:metal transporter CNNM
MPEFYSVLLSVTLVLFIGEIIPQAVCTGPNQLKIAAIVAPITLVSLYSNIISF